MQFPDELLSDTLEIVLALQESGKKLYVLADTTYGSEFVDEVCISLSASLMPARLLLNTPMLIVSFIMERLLSKCTMISFSY